MKVDRAPCWHCRRMFEPWTNERYCSDTCHDAAQRATSPDAARRVATLIGLFELAASMGDDLTEDEVRTVAEAERAAHFPEHPGTEEEDQ